LEPICGTRVSVMSAALLDLPAADRAATLETHGIPPLAFEALHDGDGEGFIRLRADDLAERERTFMVSMEIEPNSAWRSDAAIDTE